MSTDREITAPQRFNRDLRDTRLLFAPGAVLELPSQLKSLRLSRAFVVTTGGKSAGLVPPDDLLGDTLVEVFSAAREHVPVATIAKALKRFRMNHADVCVAIGGGTAIGLGKALARETGAPLVAVPTTYSGSEMTSIWGRTDDTGKHTGRDPKAKPRLVIYDVTLTFGLPADVSAASGMNALAHAVEASYGESSAETRDTADEAVSLLVGALPGVVAKGTDLVARSKALAGAHLAARSLEDGQMGLHHRICHVLGGSFALPHAGTHAAVLPHVVAFNAPAVPDAMKRLSDASGMKDFAGELGAFARSIGLAAGLRELGLRERDIDPAADAIVASPYPNPRAATRDDVRAILSAAL